MAMKKWMTAILLTTGLMMTLGACGAAGSGSSEQGIRTAAETGVAQLQLPKDGDAIAILRTSMGEMRFKLLSADAPKAVENFSTLAKNGKYNNLIFHRVIRNFMIQGGDPKGDGTGGESIWGQPFEDEFTMTAFNFRGALSMANSGANTNGSQFFVVQANAEAVGLGDEKSIVSQLESGGWPKEAAAAYGKIGGTPHLDQKHTVFGQIYKGLDVLDAIAGVETVTGDKPKTDVKIESIDIGVYGK